MRAAARAAAMRLPHSRLVLVSDGPIIHMTLPHGARRYDCVKKITPVVKNRIIRLGPGAEIRAKGSETATLVESGLPCAPQSATSAIKRMAAIPARPYRQLRVVRPSFSGSRGGHARAAENLGTATEVYSS